MKQAIRRSTASWAVAALACSCLTAAASARAAPVAPAARAPSPPRAGASNVTDLGAAGWMVQSSAIATQGGARISTPGFGAPGWLPVSNDGAGAPGTEVEAMLQNGRCPDDPGLQPVNQSLSGPHSIFFSDNMKRCFGQMTRIGADTIKRFAVPWWWRTDFSAGLRPGQVASLVVNGVIGSANVWVNGTQVATSSTVTGAYTRFTVPITRLLVPGTNALAIEINPNDPRTMFTLDNVDWTQIPPDNNTGIQFPVQLRVDGALAVGNSRVDQSDAANLSSAALTVTTDVTNASPAAKTGTVTATITPPYHGRPITVRQRVTVPARSTRTVSFTPAGHPGLRIVGPRVWWPYQLGAQPLYTLDVSVARDGVTLNSTSETFGIRTVTSRLVGRSAAEPAGARAFKVNGVPIVIRGGGWDPNLFLRYSAADTARQIALMKNMGINAIRLEGHIMPQNFFEQMDRAGILVNGGFQCCDAWQVHGTLSRARKAVLRDSALVIGENLRNHPSVFSFQWSDNAPTRGQEAVSLAGFRAADFRDPLISSAEYNSSRRLGVSGEKEGPYDWVPPGYWYDTRHHDAHDRTQTNAGGAWGYDSEESAGDTIPTIDSLRRFLSPADLSRLWRDPAYNQYHLNYERRGHANYHFGTLFNFDAALRARYGAWHSLAGYVREAQVLDYEDTRAQFEAFIDHANSRPLPSTGTIYWQLNKGWPSMLWTLYNDDGDQAGSYFGAREANRPLHALYALGSGTVTLDNLGRTAVSGLSVTSKVYSAAGRLLDDQRARGITLAGQQVRTGVLTPRVPAVTAPPRTARVYFVELLLRDSSGRLIDRNVYWLSTQRDIVNWRATLDQPEGIIARYANLTSLRSLRPSSVSVRAVTRRRAGPDGADLATTVVIRNTSSSTVAFFLRADVRRGTPGGRPGPGDNELRSSIWQGNDITLFPGESQTLVVTYSSADLNGATPVISVYGWNVPEIDVAAPVRRPAAETS